LKTLHAALTDYSLTAALQDRRFSPIEAAELPHLRCTISLLSNFELAAAWDDWEIGTHGKHYTYFP
jgi:AMMECR1 domain-containing protein